MHRMLRRAIRRRAYLAAQNDHVARLSPNLPRYFMPVSHITVTITVAETVPGASTRTDSARAPRQDDSEHF